MKITCPKCKTEVSTGVWFCPNCGAPLSEDAPLTVPSGGYAPTQNELGMKWFKFIIYFQLFANVLFRIINGIQVLTGIIYDTDVFTGEGFETITSEMIYSSFPGLYPTNVIYGILTLALAAYAIYVRQQLAHYHQGAPKKYLTFLVLNLGLELVYLAAASIILGEWALDAEIALNMITAVILLVVNYIYFKNRAHLFAN